jgi:thymidylate synthase (FAD)
MNYQIDTLTPSIHLLDHGYVRLVDYMGSDLSVVRAARVSYDAAWRAGEDQGSDRRLINYLWSHKHTTPFEAVNLTFEVHAPIFVFRQWHRHRTWSFNELSARYRELPEEFYVPAIEQICEQSKNNKQGRGQPLDPKTAEAAQHILRISGEHAFNRYRTLLEAGVARELARTVLPVSTYSTMFATVNLLNLFKFIGLRSDPHAQYEIRVFSDAMLELVREVAPVCVEAFEASLARDG